MESFKDVVDTLGGISVNSTFAFNYDGYSFGKGNISLNGDEIEGIINPLNNLPLSVLAAEVSFRIFFSHSWVGEGFIAV